MKYFNHLIAGTLALAFLSACGGGSSSNSGPSIATVTSSNVQDLAIASTNAANQSKTANTLNIFGKTGGTDTQIMVSEMIAKGVTQMQQAPTDIGMCSSGTGIMDTNGGTTATITFTNCTMINSEPNPVILNGTAYFSSSSNGDSMTLQYVNFTINFDGDVSVIDASISCSGLTTTSVTCSYNVDFTGANGRHYILGSLSVSGDPFTGMTISATVTDPIHGNINFNTTTPVTFNCASPNEHIPNSGTIIFTGANSSTGSVTYNDCASYSVTFNGVTNSYNW